MAITKITVHVSLDSIGDGTQEDLDGYLEWLDGELTTQFPAAYVTADDASSLETVAIETDEAGGYYAELANVQEFVQACWERCPWTWVKTA